jgi:hypothetical protein
VTLVWQNVRGNLPVQSIAIYNGKEFCCFFICMAITIQDKRQVDFKCYGVLWKHNRGRIAIMTVCGKQRWALWQTTCDTPKQA